LLAYFEFEVSLRGAEPRIWRRFLIAETASFLHLHEAIQEACGWLNCHLFTFRDRKGKAIAGLPDDEDGDPDPDARKVKLRSYFGRARSCLYEYDFGDSWEHEVTLQGIVERPEKFGRMLLGGERAFPPEDCGGIPGYEECVRVARGGKICDLAGLPDDEGNEKTLDCMVIPIDETFGTMFRNYRVEEERHLCTSTFSNVAFPAPKHSWHVGPMI
jgi:hypothetical protein